MASEGSVRGHLVPSFWPVAGSTLWWGEHVTETVCHLAAQEYRQKNPKTTKKQKRVRDKMWFLTVHTQATYFLLLDPNS